MYAQMGREGACVIQNRKASTRSFILSHSVSLHPTDSFPPISKIKSQLCDFQQRYFVCRAGIHEEQHKPIIINLISVINCLCIIM